MPRIMRSLLLGSIPLIWVASALPQASIPSEKEDDLYAIALAASVREMQKSWGEIDDSDKGRIRTDYHHLLVRKNPEITDDLPTDFGTYHIRYLDDKALIARFKALRKEFSILEIHPLHNKDGRLEIQVSVAWLEYQNGRTTYAVSDWSDVEFTFNCEQQKYTVSHVQLGGI